MSLQNSRREMYQKLLSFEQGRTANNWSISWTGRAITIGHGVDNAGATIGHYDIVLPPVGTVITGINTPAVTVTATGILLGQWQTLYYIPQTRTANTSDPANFRIVNYNVNLVLPDNALMIAHRVGNACIKWGDDMGFTDANGNLKTSQAAEFDYQAYADGLTRVSLAGEVSWTGIIRTMSAGRTLQEPSGYHDITMPPVGTVIPVNTGTAPTVVAATAGRYSEMGGIPLTAWQTLWYKIVDGSNQASVAANFRIQTYTAASTLLTDGSDANDWVKIVSRDQNDKFHWHFNGDTMSFGQIGDGSMSLMKIGYDNLYKNWRHNGFAYVGHNDGITAFGLTGRLRFIGGGRQVSGNVHGYVDIDQAERNNGRVVTGVGVADRTWRTAVDTDRMTWFGAMAAPGQVNAMGATSTFVQLNANEQLYWCVNPASPANSGNWYVTNSAQDAIPPHWLLIAATGDASDYEKVHIPYANERLATGEAKWSSKGDATQKLRMKADNVHFNGWYDCRFGGPGAHFSGSGTNGVINGSGAVLTAWEDNTFMIGAGSGYEDADVQYSWCNIPPNGYEIPVIGRPGITRQVMTLSGRRYFPLGIWENLYYIPPKYSGQTTLRNEGFIVSYIGDAVHMDAGAWLIARGPRVYVGASRLSSEVKLMDGTLLKPGVQTASGTAVVNDHATGTSSLWRNITVAGETPPAGTAGLASIPGVARYPVAQYNPRFKVEPASGRGLKVSLIGLISATQDIPGSPVLFFLPGVWLYGSSLPIPQAYINTDNGPVQFGLRLTNATIGGQQGIQVAVETNDLSNTQARWDPATSRRWISLDHITFTTEA